MRETGEVLAVAIGAERPVLITYTAADGEQTTRTIEPYQFATTGTGAILVRAMDRRTGEPRTFRLDRIQVATLRDGAFEIERHVGVTHDLMPEIHVRYHGSQGRHHGVMRLLGICGCVRCASLGVRYRLAEVGRHEAAVWCVRATSITPITDEPEDAEESALARIRAEIALVPEYDHVRDAAHWSPGT